MEVECRNVILIKVTVTTAMEQTCLPFGGFARKEFYSHIQYNLVS